MARTLLDMITPTRPQRRELRPWIGIAADVVSTLVLLVLNFDPAFEVVTRYRRESALALGVLHMILVPSAILTALVRSEKLELFTDRPDFVRGATEMSLSFFYVFGWLMPLLMFAQRVDAPSWLVAGCMGVHLAPLLALVFLTLVNREHWLDRLAEWIAHRWGPQAVMYGAYLAGIEIFLLLARSERHGFGPLPLLIWAAAYLPARLLLARLSGLQGLERWTFFFANVHLLVRLLSAEPR